ncbi:hypothetical protein AT238_06250 [Bartonella henselae]|nr:hypothetical protein AT238_06250 [Bartonella henselae]
MNRLKNQGLQHRDLAKRMMGLVCFFMSVKMALLRGCKTFIEMQETVFFCMWEFYVLKVP